MTKDAREQNDQEARSTIEGKAAKETSRFTDTVEALRGDLRAFVMDSGYRVFLDLLEDARELLCGPRYTHVEESSAYRHGYDQGKLVLGGRKISVPKPRVRTNPLTHP